MKLPPFPSVALRISEALSHGDPDLNRVVRLINAEPAFAAELLRTANSALFGFSRKIKSVQHAALALGFEFVRSLAMAVALRSFMGNAPKLPELRRCWRHCLACAILSEEIARTLGRRDDTAYTAGLLHDIGRLALLAAYPQEYSNALGVSLENRIDLLMCERDLFDVDHCQAGQWLAGEWNLPVEIATAIGEHHGRPRRPDAADLVSLTQIGCGLADALGFGAVASTPTHPAIGLIAQLPPNLRPRLDIEQLMDSAAKRIRSLE